MLYKILNLSTVITVGILTVGIITLIFSPEYLSDLSDNRFLLYLFSGFLIITASLAMMNVRRKKNENQKLTREDAIRSISELVGIGLVIAFFNGVLM
ncbi:hypothetical protein [Geomicrobium sp. JCM 19037]|uniref:hypothetical protein n=1 Tax=Geomicrobium sp. JCM 19037 TaxID=1460634 RepID=UPI0005A74AA3|nr:hypothetical protein [Geomicrobium sp. JCM 19037]